MQLSGQNNASWTNSFQLLDTTAPLEDVVKIDEGQKTLECEKLIENRSQIEAIDGWSVSHHVRLVYLRREVAYLSSTS